MSNKPSTYVVFFGGYLSKQPDMIQWATSANSLRSDVTFGAYPFPANPGIPSDSHHPYVSHLGKKYFDDTIDVIQKIKDPGADWIFIVGHSSGSAIAYELYQLLTDQYSHITLVYLDGFPLDAIQKKDSNVQAWAAQGPHGEPSLHFNNRKNGFIYPSIKATNPYALHFSLVNTAATDDIKKSNYWTPCSKGSLVSMGYAKCVANLCWLPK
jgi:pimeloyl-ACP methyl ester carboxylesterase